MDMQSIDTIIGKYEKRPQHLLAILQDIQAKHNYLPREALEHVAKECQVSLSRVYNLATFFRSFSLKPRGKHICTVCMGTACHVRGSPRIRDEMERNLKVKSGQTTADGQFTLEEVNCVGACALGPLVIIDGEYHGNMTPKEINKVLDNKKKPS
jgi:NADH:ubiquinone oxidoreductase subunit E